MKKENKNEVFIKIKQNKNEKKLTFEPPFSVVVPLGIADWCASSARRFFSAG